MSLVSFERQMARWRERLDRALLRRWVQVAIFLAALGLAWLWGPRIAHAGAGVGAAGREWTLECERRAAHHPCIAHAGAGAAYPQPAGSLPSACPRPRSVTHVRARSCGSAVRRWTRRSRQSPSTRMHRS